ncbi:DUF5610 domain-containing protein [Marinobacter caseinilyticus]|uniref:DUF5610 domain-containing protein n=1 Tax=Marinobacter caseinilyticus TaxID=2692195 RepID=UPI00140A5F01|nr:DUF5610 domain-containing protein [Marinobacter caseinilyticus]
MVSPLSPFVSGTKLVAADAPNAPARESKTQESDTGHRSRVLTADDGIAVLRERLGQRMRLFGVGPAERPETGRFEPPTAAQVANRILGFVEAKLAREQASGASVERLASLLEAAREGVEKGFSEAREQIDALGLLNDDLARDIDASFKRVGAGLENLSDRFLRGEPAALAATTSTTIQATSRQQLSFEIVTRDGDRVSVTMDERRYDSKAAVVVPSADGSGATGFEQQTFVGRYEVRVTGELDQGEQQALVSLFEGAQSVSERFFSGDVLGAFKEVQSLGLGGDELASYSLNLSYARASRVASYASVAPQSGARLTPMAALADGLRDVSNRADRVSVPEASLGQLLERMMVDAKERMGVSLPLATENLMADFWQAMLGQFAESRGEDPVS